MKKQLFEFLMVLCASGAFATASQAAPHISDFDSTQPRGFGGPLDLVNPDACANGPVLNAAGQDLCPMIDGMPAPQFHASVGGQQEEFNDWKGMTMANAARDPSVFATMNVANQDFINLVNAAAGQGFDIFNADLQALVGVGTARELACFLKIYEPATPDPCVPGNPITLLPEEEIPVTADICLRCHVPTGWMEGRSEPASPHFPYLRGQFWGGKFTEYPGWPGAPRSADLTSESETDMEGVQCGFCHRTNDNFKSPSNYDGSIKPNGNSGYFVSQYDPFEGAEADVAFDIQEKAEFCGSCHEVTNPLIYTQTPASPTPMLHPLERTFTEWYWSSYRGTVNCQECHEPMKFEGAQTWLLYPGLDRLWGAVDKVWLEPPFDYTSGVTADRTDAFMNARLRNEDLMRDAADIQIVSSSWANGFLTVEVKVTNNTGHKLPTGFAEGRQMWIHLTARDDNGNILYEDGALSPAGALLRTPETKVYESVVLAERYDSFELNGTNILDNTTGDPHDGTLVYTPDGTVSHFDKEFHFILMNNIEKDNRIPPAGYNKAAYMADGAFIIPHDAKDTDYADGQNWDITPYTFNLGGYTGEVHVTAELKYQTFSDIYVEFLHNMDREPTEDFGGRARSIPCSDRRPTDGSNEFCASQTWGDVLADIWTAADHGKPVLMASASAQIGVMVPDVPGDLTGDSVVDGDDYTVFIATFARCDGQAGYNGAADYDSDGCVTFVDYQIWYSYYSAP
ncbi:MAG: hypothetical protein C4531_14430 [Desulfurivibrio sp.]|nr:MAG: hypothetical protein C4531_14430 [Desulfurivibrio sp.]